VRLARAELLRESKNAKERDEASEELKALARNTRTRHRSLQPGLSYLANGDSGSAWKEAPEKFDTAERLHTSAGYCWLKWADRPQYRSVGGGQRSTGARSRQPQMPAC